MADSPPRLALGEPNLDVLEGLLRAHDPAEGDRDCLVRMEDDDDDDCAMTVVSPHGPWTAVRLGLTVACVSTTTVGVAVGVAADGIAARFRVTWCVPTVGHERLLPPSDGSSSSPREALGELLQGSTATALARLAARGRSDETVTRPVLHLGWETNETSEGFAKLVHEVAHAAGANVVMHGEVIPPCLHACVVGVVVPQHRVKEEGIHDDNMGGGTATPDGYFDRLAQAYGYLLGVSPTADGKRRLPDNSLLVDCAGSGVTYLAVRHLVVALQQSAVMRRIVSTNRPRPPPLSSDGGDVAPDDGCSWGAAYVCAQRAPPQWYNRPPIGRTHCASLNAAADAVVFHCEETSPPTTTTATTDENGSTTFCLLQGHAMAALVCDYVASEWEALRQTLLSHDDTVELPCLRLGRVVVSSTTSAMASVCRTATAGVTHVVETAVSPAQLVATARRTLSHCDMVVAYSPTGYGCLFFGPGYGNGLVQARRLHMVGLETTARSAAALARLEGLPHLMHPAPGVADALSTLLLVDAILHLTGQTVAEAMRRYEHVPLVSSS
jgi:hypothetical protein